MKKASSTPVHRHAPALQAPRTWWLLALGFASLVFHSYVAHLSREFIIGKGQTERPFITVLIVLASSSSAAAQNKLVVSYPGARRGGMPAARISAASGAKIWREGWNSSSDDHSPKSDASSRYSDMDGYRRQGQTRARLCFSGENAWCWSPSRWDRSA